MKEEPHVIVFPPMVATNRRNGISIKTTVHFLETILYYQWQKEMYSLYPCAYKNGEEFLIGLVTEKENSKSFGDDHQQVLSSFTFNSFIVIANS